MSLFSIVPCAEKHGTREEEFSILESPAAKVTLQCDYADRYALVTDLLLNRRQWPFYVAAIIPVAVSAQIEDIPTQYGTDGQTCTYLQSDITVTYSSKIPTLFSEELEPTAQFQEVDARNFIWANGVPLTQGEAPGFLNRGLSLVRTLYDVLDPLPPQLLSYVGCCNLTQYISSLGLVFEPQTLLYTPPNLSRTVRFTGDNAWQVAMKFMYMPNGWNNFWNASAQQYMQIRSKATKWFGVPVPSSIYEPYPPREFNGVFF